MADAEQQPASLRDGSAVTMESSAEAISRLFRENNRVLVRYLTARLQSEQEAKEVAQEAYVRLLQMAAPGSPEFFRAYLFKTASNLAIDRLRHRRVRYRIEQAETPEAWTSARSDGEDPAKLLVAREFTEQLMSFLQELPPKCRVVFGLHRLEGRSQREVAARFGFSERMVRRYVTYAMVYCRLRLDGVPAEEAQEKVVL
jgi:RNA polymerase sigma-70 factor (ECF subfamily)